MLLFVTGVLALVVARLLVLEVQLRRFDVLQEERDAAVRDVLARLTVALRALKDSPSTETAVPPVGGEIATGGSSAAEEATRAIETRRVPAGDTAGVSSGSR